MPLKSNGWNVKNRPIENETHFPNLNDFGFKMLIFQGVDVEGLDDFQQTHSNTGGG